MHSHTDDTPLIELTDVSMQRDHRRVLSHVNLRVNTGDFVAITGPNGGGKTTLLRIILGLLRPTAGRVNIREGISVGYLPQKNMIDSHFPISVREVVESGLLAVRNIDKATRQDRVNEVLEQVGMVSHASHPIGELSGGQLQRTLLGRAIISHPQLLALDEPLSYIDKHFEMQLYDLIADIARDTTILLISHEMSAIAGMANRHLIIDGTLHECSAHHHYIQSECE